MRCLVYVLCLLCCCLLSGCMMFQPPLWRPDTISHVESTQALAHEMVRFCKAGSYKDQMLDELLGGANAFCQPKEKGAKLCAVLLVYPEKRRYSYTDARSYTAVVQARSWFNLVISDNDRVTRCWTETE